MTRLIDPDKFIEILIKIVPDLRNVSAKTIGIAIDMTPTVDAAPVIRCKDCANFNGDWYYCEVDILVQSYDYCSKAKRKEE